MCEFNEMFRPQENKWAKVQNCRVLGINDTDMNYRNSKTYLTIFVSLK